MADKLAGIGRFGSTVDPAFTAVKPSAETLRIAAMNAAPGQTAEQYLASRGGVNAAGYYGDSWSAKTNLSDAQYAATIAQARAEGKTGAAIGGAINAATARLIYDNAIASGADPKKAAADYNAAVQASNAANKQNVPLMTDASGNIISPTALNSGTDSIRYAADLQAQAEKDRVTAERQSAYAILESEFNKYGLGELAKTVKDLILTGTPSAEVTLKLRATPEYLKRFAGNEMRRAAGQNVYSEDVYLQLENQMTEAFAAYGVSQVLGSTREAKQAKLATFIGGTVAPTEVKRRIQMAVEEVNNRPDILKTFQTYYPSITDKDIVSYFLDPKETETRLTTKVQAAQIGSAAARQGLVTNVLSAEELAALGVTEAAANTGYAKVASALPTAMKLGELEGDAYTQAEAEGAYLKGLASEQRKLADLAAREQNRFLAASGASKGAYASGYLNRTSSAGQY